MKSNLTTKLALLDQSDCVAQIESLTVQCDALEKSLNDAGKPFPVRPQANMLGDIVEAHELMESHCARLQSLGKVAGIATPRAAANPIAAGYIKGLTATEKCLAAKANKPAAQIAKGSATARCIEAKAKLNHAKSAQ